MPLIIRCLGEIEANTTVDIWLVYQPGFGDPIDYEIRGARLSTGLSLLGKTGISGLLQ